MTVSAPAPAPRLFTPTAALADTIACPCDQDGVRWRSRISAILAERARETGEDELTILRAFIRSVGFPAALVARVEAGVQAPPAAYRQRVAELLGGEVFEAVQ
jgi:hypothetical protein